MLIQYQILFEWQHVHLEKMDELNEKLLVLKVKLELMAQVPNMFTLEQIQMLLQL